MTGEQSRFLQAGDRISWQNDRADQGTVTETNWAGLTARWDNRSQQDIGAIVIALNLGAEPVSISSSSIGFGREILLSTLLDRQGELIEDALDLRANEGAILGTPAQAG
jgi:hypothetical protein